MAVDVADPDAGMDAGRFSGPGRARGCRDHGAGPPDADRRGHGTLHPRADDQLDIPEVPPDEDARARWRALAETQGNPALQAALAQVDPVAAARIHGNDVRRMVRALEVHAATGVPLSEWHARNRAQATDDDTPLFGLNFADRETLYARIEARVDQMLADGFLDEVRGLLDAGYGRGLKPMQSLGYRHLAAYLAGEWDWETAVAELKRDTRRFAKRQLIWFRADPRIHWLSADGKTAGATGRGNSGNGENWVNCVITTELLKRQKGTSQPNE